jgi:hypothetical protein
MRGMIPSKQVTTTWVVQWGDGPGSAIISGSRGSAGGEVGTNVRYMGRALLGLSLGEIEEWPGSSQPVFESFGRVFQTVW